MLEIAIAGYCIYFLVNIYTSFMQVAYVQKAKKFDAVILTPSKYKVAGEYNIETQKLNILITFYDFILFFMWISFGLVALDNITNEFYGWEKTILFVDLFIIINWILALPFDIYTTFKLDKKYGFSNMTISLYIKIL